ncbi:MAG: transcription elongation factor GreA, partial [Paenisporosarcina sp.]
MTIEKKQSITQFGLTNLQEELDHLKSVKRKEVIARIKASRCFGLIENSDYETAREDQAFVESRI